MDAVDAHSTNIAQRPLAVSHDGAVELGNCAHAAGLYYRDDAGWDAGAVVVEEDSFLATFRAC